MMNADLSAAQAGEEALSLVGAGFAGLNRLLGD